MRNAARTGRRRSRRAALWLACHMYWLGLLFVIATGLLLAASLPQTRSKTQESYGVLLKSLVSLWREEPALRRATIIQGCLFGSFTAFWTILALQLEARYRLGAEIAGLFGIFGAVGILFAPIAGKIADRRGPHAVIALGSAIMLVSWTIFAAWGAVAGLIVGVILLDFGEQGALVSNQHIIYSLRPDARNRLNTISSWAECLPAVRSAQRVRAPPGIWLAGARSVPSLLRLQPSPLSKSPRRAGEFGNR